MELRHYRLKKNGLLGNNDLLRPDLSEEEWKKVDKIFVLYNKMNAPKWWIMRKYEAFIWKVFKSGGSYWSLIKYTVQHPLWYFEQKRLNKIS